MLEHVRGDEQLLREVIQLFLQETTPLMAELHQALAGGNVARVRRAAHSLRGAAGLFGVAGVTEAAEELESLGRSGQVAGAAEVYGRLERELGRLKAALAAFLASSPAPEAGRGAG
jgi:HPt (histidine-containing phosphotransfer) domain-containing protein